MAISSYESKRKIHGICVVTVESGSKRPDSVMQTTLKNVRNSDFECWQMNNAERRSKDLLIKNGFDCVHFKTMGCSVKAVANRGSCRRAIRQQ